MNACLTTPQHKNKSAIVCQTNGIYIKLNGKYVYIKISLVYKQCKELCKNFCYRYIKLKCMIKLTQIQ